MAAFVKISQHYVGKGDGRKDEVTWDFVNTTVQEEKRIMRHMFAPLYLRQDELPEWMFAGIKKEMNRFFKQGVFLTWEGFKLMNSALRELGLPKIELLHDGNYSQPVLPKKRKPCKQSWLANAAERAAEMKVIIQEEKDYMDQYRPASNLESFFQPE